MYRELEFELKEHLNFDEIMIWAGIPNRGIILRWADALLIPFSFSFLGIAIFIEFSYFTEGEDLSIVIFGALLVLLGLYLTIGRFYYDAARRKKTIYGLTKNRIIIKYGVFNQSIISLTIKKLRNVTLNEKPDGSGTIILGSESRFDSLMRGTGFPPGLFTNPVPAIEMISDASNVYRQITDLQKER